MKYFLEVFLGAGYKHVTNLKSGLCLLRHYQLGQLGGSGPIPNFFLDFLGFFLKALGKHWKWPDSSRNAKKKNSLLCGGVVPCTVQYRTVQNCTVQQQTLV